MSESLSLVGSIVRVRRTEKISLGCVSIGGDILIRLLVVSLNMTPFLYQLIVGAGMPVAVQTNAIGWNSLTVYENPSPGNTISGITEVRERTRFESHS